MLVTIAGIAHATPDPSWSVRVRRSEGLPDKAIVGLTQTPDRFMWIATPASVACFDGWRFETFSLELFAPSDVRRIRAILTATDGSLWIALDYGVMHLQAGQKPAVIRDLPESHAEMLVEDAYHAVWIPYQDGTVCRVFDGAVTRFIPPDANSPKALTCSLAADRFGRLWFARNGHIGVIEEGEFKSRLELKDTRIRLGPARDGGIVACGGSRIFRSDAAGHLQETAPLDGRFADIRVSVLMEDHRGTLWIGTTKDGLLRMDSSGVTRMPASHPAITCLFEDHEGDIWAGTDGGGLNQLFPRAISVEGAAAGLPSESVRSICEDSRGILWGAAKDGTLVVRTDGKWTSASPGGRQIKAVLRVAADNAGALWIATANYQLHRWDNDQLTTWTRGDGIISHSIQPLLVSHSGDVWFAGTGPRSLQSIRAGKIHNWPLPPGQPQIRTMIEDQAGTIWLAGDRGLLLRVENDTLTDETPRNPIRGNSVTCLYPAADGTLWIGTDGGGLGWLRGADSGAVQTAHGLLENGLCQIIADHTGWVWFGGIERGLFRIREDQLAEIAARRAARVQSLPVQPQDLAPSGPDINEAASTCRSRDGRLWIPMGPALVVIDPTLISDNYNPPPVFLSSIQVDGRNAARNQFLPLPNTDWEHAISAGLHLGPGHHQLEVSFTAPSFAAPESVQFRYQLEGFDRGWVEAGTQRRALYSRLPAGSYRFRVMACNHEGVWSQTEAALAVGVAPFVWQTLWFQCLVLAGFTGSVVAMVRYISHRRLRVMLKVARGQTALERERTRIARDLHDDLGSRLTEILLLSRRAIQEPIAPPAADEHVRQIETKVQQGINSLDETVWAVNPRNDTLSHLVDYLSHYAFTFLQAAGIRFRFKAPKPFADRPLPVEMRHHLLLVVKEALTNIVRHAQASEVLVKLDMAPESLAISIEDNGQGFQLATPSGSADGLQNMRQRMSEIGGQLLTESAPDTGTRIFLTLPWTSR